jgi:hypothetical protein
MGTMQQGWTPDKTALGLMAYAAFQELATRISHRSTGRYSDTRWPTRSWCGWPPMRTCT